MILGTSIKSGAGRENPNLTQGTNASKDIKAFDFNVSSPMDQ